MRIATAGSWVRVDRRRSFTRSTGSVSMVVIRRSYMVLLLFGRFRFLGSWNWSRRILETLRAVVVVGHVDRSGGELDSARLGTVLPSLFFLFSCLKGEKMFQKRQNFIFQLFSLLISIPSIFKNKSNMSIWIVNLHKRWLNLFRNSPHIFCPTEGWTLIWK